MGRSGSSMQLMRIFGIRVGVDTSWFFILFIAIFFLQDAFKGTVEGSDTTAYVAAVAAAFLFFAAIVLHELGHALAARREGIHVSGIDLFFFGGVMRMSSDTASPGAEFRVAVAGPLVTLLLAIAATAIGVATDGGQAFLDAAFATGGGRIGVALLLLSLFAQLNLGLLVFNLVPALPLDGGRMARAIVWKLTGDRTRATKVTAALGQGFGWLLIGFGLFVAIVWNNLYNGIYLAILGWLLRQSASGAVVQSAVTQRLEGITVADVMDAEPVTIPAQTTARDAYEGYFLRYHDWDWFAVVEDDGRYVGRAERVPVQTAAYDGAGERPVGELTPDDAEGRVPADAPLESLLGSDALRRLGVLMAVDPDGRLRGVVTLGQVSRALRSHLATG